MLVRMITSSYCAVHYMTIVWVQHEGNGRNKACVRAPLLSFLLSSPISPPPVLLLLSSLLYYSSSLSSLLLSSLLLSSPPSSLLLFSHLLFRTDGDTPVSVYLLGTLHYCQSIRSSYRLYPNIILRNIIRCNIIQYHIIFQIVIQ